MPEGKCGGSKAAMPEGRVRGGSKAAMPEGKCGTGKCGGTKAAMPEASAVAPPSAVPASKSRIT